MVTFLTQKNFKNQMIGLTDFGSSLSNYYYVIHPKLSLFKKVDKKNLKSFFLNKVFFYQKKLG